MIYYELHEPQTRPPSRRQLEVLAQLATGKNNAQAGEALGIKKATVRNHMARINQRMGTKNSTHALAVCVAHGYITLRAHEMTMEIDE